jgi:hypothetical protein
MQLAIFFDNDLIYLGFEAKQARIFFFWITNQLLWVQTLGKYAVSLILVNDPTAMRANASIFANTFRSVTHPIHWGIHFATMKQFYISLTFFKKIQIAIIAPSINL